MGSCPAASSSSTMAGSSPSSPITITFFKARPSREKSPSETTIPVVAHSRSFRAREEASSRFALSAR